MIGKALGSVWRRVPRRMRRWRMLLAHARFTVTTGAVIVDDQGRVLLLNHRFRVGSGWGIPGGFIEPGEQPEAAPRRGRREEVGLELERADIAFVRTLEHIRQVEVIFRCRPRGEARPQGLEVRQAAWFPPGELPPGLSRDQRALIARAL